MAFENTMDKYGDEVITDMFIERTIEEYCDDSATIIGQHAFNGCAALAEVDIPNVTRIYTNGFNGCSSLTTVNVPALTGLYGYEFAACTKLVSMKFPSVTLTDCSGYGPFSGSGVEILDFPVLTNIKGQPFYSAKFLRSVILRSSTVCVLNTTIDYVFAATSFPTNGYIYVPRALVDSYKAATNWSAIADRFKPLENYTVDGTITGEFKPRGNVTLNMLYGVSSSNEETFAGRTYRTMLTPLYGTNIVQVTVLMNGVDVTDSVYSNGEVNITNVTGDIVITAKAELATMYQLANTPKTVNADLFEDTGLTFGSSNANGVVEGWTIVTTYTPSKLCDLAGIQNIERGVTIGYNHHQGKFMPCVYCSGGQWGPSITKNGIQHKLVVVHTAGNTGSLQCYAKVDGTSYSGTASRTYDNLSNSTYAGNLYIGGYSGATFEGTIEDFKIYHGVLTEDDVNNYLNN